MRKLLIAAVLAAGPAYADLVAKIGSDEIRLMPSPCVHGETLARIAPEHRSRFKKAEARIGGHRYYACWTEMGEVAGIIYEDGDQGILPLAQFKESGV